MAKAFNSILKEAALKFIGLKRTTDGESYVTTVAQESCALATHSAAGVAATKWAVLIDKSDIVNWPHKVDAPVNIAYVALQVDKASATQGRMGIGVITRIDGTSADVTTVRGLTFTQSTDDHFIRSENFSQAIIRTDVVSGNTPFIISSSKFLNVTAINTATPLESPRGAATVTPALGDIVMLFEHTSGSAWTGSATILYTTEKV